MKVLFIGHEYNMNGASKALIEIISQIEKDHNVFVLTKYGSGPFYNEICKHNVKILVFPFTNICERNNIHLRWLFRFIKWHLIDNRVNRKTTNSVVKIIKEEGIQLVHSNTSVVDMGIRIKEMCGIPHIMHLREFGDLDFNMVPFVSKKAYFSAMNKFTDYFICISKAIQSHYFELVSEKKILIYDGIPMNKVNHTNITRKDANVNILLAGRISKEKGQNQAYKAMMHLIDDGYDNYHLFLAGSGKLFIRPKYKKNVHKLGFVKDMSKIRETMDLEIVCSKSEAFGRVTVEAMLSENPVIGSNTGGTVELIDDRENGLLYSYGDFVELANKIIEFVHDDELRRKCIERAYTDVKEKYSLERCVNDILRVYSIVLEGKNDYFGENI